MLRSCRRLSYLLSILIVVVVVVVIVLVLVLGVVIVVVVVVVFMKGYVSIFYYSVLEATLKKKSEGNNVFQIVGACMG